MYDKQQKAGLTVFISEIPWHVVSFSIIRKNLSNIDSEDVVVAKNINLRSDGNDNLLSFDDIGLFDRNFYEYRVVFWSDDGIQRESITKHRVVYFEADRNAGVTNLGTPIVTNQGGADVTFEIKVEKNKFEADLIQQALTLEGTKEEFQELLNGNINRLSPVVQTSLYRTNTETGEVDFYGIIDSSLFVDSTYGPKKGIERPQIGVKYIYTAITHKRNPETLFYDYEKTIVNPITQQSYKLKPAFAFHPVRLRESLIVNETWLDKQPYDIFTFGDAVDIDQVEITIPTIMPEIINTECRIIGAERILVTWMINGDQSYIDHFMVFLNHNGIDTPVGVSRANNLDSRYEFVDVLNNGESGILQYKIIPVYYDLVNGRTAMTNKVTFFV